jgi:hypothetical protein
MFRALVQSQNVSHNLPIVDMALSFYLLLRETSGLSSVTNENSWASRQARRAFVTHG